MLEAVPGPTDDTPVVMDGLFPPPRLVVAPVPSIEPHDETSEGSGESSHAPSLRFPVASLGLRPTAGNIVAAWRYRDVLTLVTQSDTPVHDDLAREMGVELRHLDAPPVEVRSEEPLGDERN